MNIEELKAIITAQKEDIESLFEREPMINRDIDTTRVKNYLSTPNVLAILGIRRCGKSIFSWLLLSKEQFGYINFFDERLIDLKAEELNQVIQAFYELYGNDVTYFVFDEIQKVPNWERFVSRLRTTNKIVITGSNSDLLRGNLELSPGADDVELRAVHVGVDEAGQDQLAGMVDAPPGDVSRRQLSADDGAAFDQQPMARAETHRIAVAVGARRRGHEVQQVSAQSNRVAVMVPPGACGAGPHGNAGVATQPVGREQAWGGPAPAHDNFSGTASCRATSRTRSRSQRSGGAAWVRSCHSW